MLYAYRNGSSISRSLTRGATPFIFFFMSENILLGPPPGAIISSTSLTEGECMEAGKQLRFINPPDLSTNTLASRAAGLDWECLYRELRTRGHAVTPEILDEKQCRELVALFDGNLEAFRARVVMERHAFGAGEYKYFSYPLPQTVAMLRSAVYPYLAPLANSWTEQLGLSIRYPQEHGEFLEWCRQRGQTKATPLMLKYKAGDYNRLHQDLYGELVFPLQLVISLSEPGKDFEGGEFIMVEQRPRQQSIAEAISIKRGHGVIFTVAHRPAASARGFTRVNLRHGVSRIRNGLRFALGVIFHDAP